MFFPAASLVRLTLSDQAVVFVVAMAFGDWFVTVQLMCMDLPLLAVASVLTELTTRSAKGRGAMSKKLDASPKLLASLPFSKTALPASACTNRCACVWKPAGSRKV